jgi:hypothetical protein
LLGDFENGHRNVRKALSVRLRFACIRRLHRQE